MLRIHFTEADLARLRVAAVPDPLWEIAVSLHRFQTRRGRWAYAGWYRTACTTLHDSGLSRTVRELLLPLFPLATYFPDFLTPVQSQDGLERGLKAIAAASPSRVRSELEQLARVRGVRPWAPRVAETENRADLVRALRGYHDAVIAPYGDRIQARIDTQRAVQARAFLDAGIEGLLRTLGPGMRWQSPVLSVEYCQDRDLHLNGRGLTLVPSYFCWSSPISLADPDLPPVLVCPLAPPSPDDEPSGSRSVAPVAALLGRTRAAVLRVTADGAATTNELARAVGVSAATVTHHTTALRDAGLVTSQRHAVGVLHVLTPLGAALLRGGARHVRVR